jgi:hypothetical protein
MAPESPREYPPTTLLAGSVPCPLEAEADRAAEAGWRFNQVPDVYAATVRLLRTDRPRPDAVLVLIESLRGDELRFFDLLARRWPDLPVAAVYCLCAEDRRLEACRRRDVTVLAANGLADWLIAQRPAMRNATRQPSAATGDPPPSNPTTSASGATGSLSASALAQDSALPPVGLDVTLDLPDGLVDLPDPDGVQAELSAQREYSAADLPDLPDGPDDQEEIEIDEDSPPGEEETEDAASPDAETFADRVPLTPWSNVPRAERRRPARTPPREDGNGQPPAPPQRPAQSAAPLDSVTGSSPPIARNPPPRARPSGWEHGLLTPEELRALLQDADGTDGPQETEP